MNLSAMLVSLLAVLSSMFLPLACRAYSADDPIKHFLHQNGDMGLPLLSWDRPIISYEHVGDRSPSVNGEIDQLLTMISKATGLQIARGAKTASIFMIYEADIFNQLMKEPNKLKRAGFSEAIIAELQKSFGNKPTLKCISQDVVDRSGNITGAFILSSDVSEECVKPLIYNLFGVAGGESDADTLLYACILYKAKARGLTSPDAIRPQISSITDDCTLKMH